MGALLRWALRGTGILIAGWAVRRYALPEDAPLRRAASRQIDAAGRRVSEAVRVGREAMEVRRAELEAEAGGALLDRDADGQAGGGGGDTGGETGRHLGRPADSEVGPRDEPPVV